MGGATPDPSSAIPAAGEIRRPYAALAVPAFRWYLGNITGITVAMGLQAGVVGWQVFELTGKDKLALGMIGLAEAIPSIGVSLFAGHFADRHDRRRILIGATAALLLCSFALLGLSTSSPGRGDVWFFYVVIVVTGFARGLLSPARAALGADIVPREHLATSVSLRTTAFHLAQAVGPALGGLLYWGWGATVAYTADAVIVAAALLSGMALRAPVQGRAERGDSIWRSLREGIAFVFHQKVILSAISLDLFAVLFGGAVILLPAFCKEVIDAGPAGYGMLRASPAAGALAMAAFLPWLPPFRRAGATLLWAVAAFGVAMVGFALSPSFWISLALLFLSGAADYVSVVIRHTLVQVRTPPHLLGRVSSVNAVFINSSNELGSFESGVAAHWLGLVPSVVFGGAVTLAVVVFTAWKSPELRALGRLK